MTYIPQVLKNTFGFTAGQTLMTTACYLIPVILWLPVAERIADMIGGSKKVIAAGSVLVALTVPAVLAPLPRRIYQGFC